MFDFTKMKNLRRGAVAACFDTDGNIIYCTMKHIYICPMNNPSRSIQLTDKGFKYLTGIDVDLKGEYIYFTDCLSHCVYQMCIKNRKISVYAGTLGVSGHKDGKHLSALFHHPCSICLDQSNGIIYVTEESNHCVRKLTKKMVATIAGKPGKAGLSDGIGQAAMFNWPSSVCLDGSRGNLILCDRNNNRICHIESKTGLVRTIAGSGEEGDKDDPDLEVAQFNLPCNACVIGREDRDAHEFHSIIVCDYGNQSLREISLRGTRTILQEKKHNFFFYGKPDLNGNLILLRENQLKYQSMLLVPKKEERLVVTSESSGPQEVVEQCSDHDNTSKTKTTTNNQSSVLSSPSKSVNTRDKIDHYESSGIFPETSDPVDEAPLEEPLVLAEGEESTGSNTNNHNNDNYSDNNRHRVIATDFIHLFESGQFADVTFIYPCKAPSDESGVSVSTNSGIGAKRKRDEPIITTNATATASNGNTTSDASPGKVEIRAHRQILCARSSYFRSYYSDPNNNAAAAADGVFNMLDIDYSGTAEAMNALLYYIYGGNLQISPEILIDLMWLGSHFQLNNLCSECVQYCGKYLRQVSIEISGSLAIQWLIQSDDYKLKELYSATLDFIAASFNSILKIHPVLFQKLTEKPEVLMELMKKLNVKSS